MEKRMRNDALATILGALVLCAVAPAVAQDSSTQEGLEQLQDTLTKTIAGSMSNAAVYDTNGFHIQSAEVEQLGATFKPNGTRFQLLWVTADDVFKVGVEK